MKKIEEPEGMAPAPRRSKRRNLIIQKIAHASMHFPPVTIAKILGMEKKAKCADCEREEKEKFTSMKSM